jgi:hypothetical protein
MTDANPKTKVTRTDIARYINDHSDRFPELIRVRNDYLEKCNRARKLSVAQFGFWLRSNQPEMFDRIFKKCSKSMEILKDIYTQNESCA